MIYLNKFIPFKPASFFLLKNSLFFILFFIVLSFCETTQAASKTLNLVVGKYECTKNADCAGEDMYCDIDNHVCRNQCAEKITYQCHNNSDCSGEEAFCDVDDHVCKQWPVKCHKEMCALKEVCENVLDECDENQHFLDGYCVECVSNADCTTAEKPFCNTDGFVCDSCPADRPYWYAGLHICVGCLTDEHCIPDGKICRTIDYTCQTCYTIDHTKPFWNGSECEACPLNKPLWDGTECVACPADKPTWNGNQCVVCVTNEDCTDATKPFCRASENDGLGLCTCPDKTVYLSEWNACGYAFPLNMSGPAGRITGVATPVKGGGSDSNYPTLEADYTMVWQDPQIPPSAGITIYKNGDAYRGINALYGEQDLPENNYLLYERGSTFYVDLWNGLKNWSWYLRGTFYILYNVPYQNE